MARGRIVHEDRSKYGWNPTAHYVGQDRRGNPGALRPAIVDLTHAIEALKAARDELEVALHVEDWRRYERLVLSARSRAELGQRFVATALKGRPPRKRKVPAVQLRLRGVK